MVYIRGQREDYDSWAADGNDGWSYNEVLPYFKRSEHKAEGGNDFHGGVLVDIENNDWNGRGRPELEYSPCTRCETGDGTAEAITWDKDDEVHGNLIVDNGSIDSTRLTPLIPDRTLSGAFKSIEVDDLARVQVTGDGGPWTVSVEEPLSMASMGKPR